MGHVPTINLKSFKEDTVSKLVETEAVDGTKNASFESVKTTTIEHGNVVVFCPDHPELGVKWANKPDNNGHLHAQCAECERDTLAVQAR